MTVRLDLRVQPNARRTRFVGWHGNVPKLAVAAPPVDGAANDQTVSALAALLDLRPRQVRLIGGEGSRSKRFEVDGLTAHELWERLCELNPPRV